MNPTDGYTIYYATATGLQSVTTVSAHLKSIVFCGTGTGAVQVFAGVTSSVSATPVIRAFATVAGATANPAFALEMQTYHASGITINVVGSLDPRIMLFWRPVPVGS